MFVPRFVCVDAVIEAIPGFWGGFRAHACNRPVRSSFFSNTMPFNEFAAPPGDAACSQADGEANAEPFFADVDAASSAAFVPPDATADDLLGAFARSMRAFACAYPGADAACTVPALLGVLRAGGAAAEDTQLDALMALNSFLASSANVSAAHNAGAVALLVGLIGRESAQRASSRSMQRMADCARPLASGATHALLLLSAGESCARLVGRGGAVRVLAEGPLTRGETEPESACAAAQTIERIASSGPDCRHAISLSESTLAALLDVVELGHKRWTSPDCWTPTASHRQVSEAIAREASR